MLFRHTQKAAPTVGGIIARPKAIVIKGIFTEDDQHAYFKGYRYGSEADALADTNSTDLEDEVRNRKYRDDDDLVAGQTYWYRFSSVDDYDNESLKSPPVSETFAPVKDGDLDTTEPGQPGTPALTQIAATYNADGSIEAGLQLDFTAPSSGRVPKRYFVELWRSLSVGTSGSLTGYTLVRTFYCKKLSKQIVANARYYYKARVTPVAGNEVDGTPSDVTAVGVQPLGLVGTEASGAKAAAIGALALGTASGLDTDTDGTLAANSDSKIATQKATKTYADTELALKAPIASPALTGTPTAPTASATTNTTQIATTAMVQSAVAAYVAAQDLEVFKGSIDCSGNPNYPAADAGHVYRVSVAGKIGGASGVNVEVNDRLECLVDSSGSGTQAAVGANWMISQVNIDGAVVGPASATSGNIATFSGTSGKIIQDSGKALPSGTLLGSNHIGASVQAYSANLDAVALALSGDNKSTDLKIKYSPDGTNYAADMALEFNRHSGRAIFKRVQNGLKPWNYLRRNWVTSNSWISSTSAADNSWFSICWSPELQLFVAVAATGTGNRVMTSPDGITWTIRTSAADNDWRSVVWSPELSLFVAVAATGTGNRVMTSPDGITWTIRTSAADNQWITVCWSSELSLFVAVANTGTGNRVMTSPDGVTWTTRTSAADNDWIGVCWSPELGLFCAVAQTGTGNRVMTSPDGVTWTIRTSAADNNWRSIAWSAELGLFAAVANSGAGNRVMTSPDGSAWTARASAADNDWRSIAWAPEIGLFAAVSITGTGNRIMTSPDGITWTVRTNPVDLQWLSACWSPELGLFAAVGQTGTGNRVMTSKSAFSFSYR